MRIGTALAACAAILVAGCFTLGAPFQAPAEDTLHLGRTTPGELLAAIGAPAIASEVTVRGAALQCYEFDAYKSGGNANGKRLLGRSATYCFGDGVLVGYVLVSNVPGESTDFDADKARTIGPGMSRAQVIALLGKPAGVAIGPIAQAQSGTQLRYSYTGYELFQKTLLKDAYIELDAAGVVVTTRVAVRQA